MKNYSLILDEEELKEQRYCTDATALKADGILHLDALGVLAQANGMNMDPSARPELSDEVSKFAKIALDHHMAKHEENIAVSFDAWMKSGRDVVEWFREKGYIA